MRRKIEKVFNIPANYVLSNTARQWLSAVAWLTLCRVHGEPLHHKGTTWEYSGFIRVSDEGPTWEYSGFIRGLADHRAHGFGECVYSDGQSYKGMCARRGAGVV